MSNTKEITAKLSRYSTSQLKVKYSSLSPESQEVAKAILVKRGEDVKDLGKKVLYIDPEMQVISKEDKKEVKKIEKKSLIQIVAEKKSKKKVKEVEPELEELPEEIEEVGGEIIDDELVIPEGKKVKAPKKAEKKETELTKVETVKDSKKRIKLNEQVNTFIESLDVKKDIKLIEKIEILMHVNDKEKATDEELEQVLALRPKKEVKEKKVREGETTSSKILKLHEEGKSPSMIGKELGIRPAFAYNVLKRNEIAPNPTPKAEKVIETVKEETHATAPKLAKKK